MVAGDRVGDGLGVDDLDLDDATELGLELAVLEE